MARRDRRRTGWGLKLMADSYGTNARDLLLRHQGDAAYPANFEQAAVGMAQLDLEAKLTRVNRALSEMLGYTQEEMVGRSFESFSHPDDVANSPALHSEMTSGKLRSPRVEKRYLRKDGSVVWARVDSVVIEDDQGDPAYFLVTVEDITERKSHDQRISQLNRTYKVLSGVNQALVRLRDPQAMFEEACRVLVEDGGYAMARVGLVEPDGVHVRSAAAASNSEAHRGAFHLALSDESTTPSPVAIAISENRREVVQDIEGDAVSAPWRTNALRDGHHSAAAFPLTVGGRVIGALNIAAAEPEFFDPDQLALLDELASDISFALDVAQGQEKRQHAEEALVESQAWLLESQHTAHIGHYVYDIGKDWWDGSTTLYEVLGIDEGYRRDLAGWLATVHLADRDEMSAYFTESVLGKRVPFDKDYRVTRLGDGAERWVNGKGKVEWSDDGQALSMFGTIQDITERKRAEEQHEAILQSAMDGFWLCDPEGQLREVNSAYCEMTGYTESELLTMNVSDLEVLETREEVGEHAARVAKEGRDRFETKHRRKDGTVFDVESSVRLQPETGLLSAFQRDITDRKHAEERLGRAFSSLVEVVGRVTETRDPYTAGHQRRVAELSAAIAERMGMPDEEVEEIHNAALVHDIGKMSIPAEILSKPGALMPVEFELIKGHAKAGYEILEASDMPGQVPEIVYQHHERCDGSGYPRGLCGDDLLPEAKVIMVADVVEAMMSHRPYRPGLGRETALGEIQTGAGTRYCPDVADACRAVFRDGFEFSQT